MVKKHIEKLPYLLSSLLLFIIMPFTYYFFNNKSEVLINLLIIIFPIVTYIVAFIYSYNKEDFSYLLSIVSGLLFLISCIILFNFEIYVYTLVYILVSLCGQGSGYWIKKLVNLIRYIQAKRQPTQKKKIIGKNKKNIA